MLTKVMLVCLGLWILLLISDYGILTARVTNHSGFELSCEYLTAKGLVNADYFWSDSDTSGINHCPLLRKEDVM